MGKRQILEDILMISQSDLNHFTGTESYHRYNNFLLLTDGAKYLFEKGECFWLLDLITSVQNHFAIKDDPNLQYIQFWTLFVNEDKSAEVICERDTDDIAYKQEIHFTDFPFSTKVWLSRLDEQYFVVMLPSEY